MPVLFPFKFNWREPVTVSTAYKTEVITSRDKTEQRRALRANPRREVEFSALAARGGVVPLLGTLTRQLQAEFVIPDHFRFARVTANLVSGEDEIPLGTPLPWWVSDDAYVVLETEEGWKLAQVESVNVDDGIVTLTEGTTAAMRQGRRVWAGQIGRVEQTGGVKMHTSSVAEFDVLFKADPVVNDLTGQDLPADMPDVEVSTTVGGSGVQQFSDFGISTEAIDAGEVTAVIYLHAVLTGVGLGTGIAQDGSASVSIRAWTDDDGEPGSLTVNETEFGFFTGEVTHQIEVVIPPGTRWFEFDSYVLRTYPIYSVQEVEYFESFKVRPKANSGTAQGQGFRNVPLFLRQPNWGESVDLSYQGWLETVDNDFGAVENIENMDWNEVVFRCELVLRDQDAIWDMVDFFNRMKGQQGYFYMPTWVDDFDVSIGCAAGDLILDVPGTDLWTYYSDMEMFDAAVVFFANGNMQANGIVEIGTISGNSRFIFEDAWDQPISKATVKQMCFLPKCRMVLDTLSVELQTDSVAKAQIAYKMIPVDKT